MRIDSVLDGKGRLFGVVSVVDLFAVVVLVAIGYAVFSAAQSRAGNRAGISDEQWVEITFVSHEACAFAAERLVAGGNALHGRGSHHLGRVTHVETGESFRFVHDTQGNEIAAANPGFVSVTVRTRLLTRLSDGAPMIGGNLYPVGSDLQIWVGNAVFTVYVAAIQPEEQSDI